MIPDNNWCGKQSYKTNTKPIKAMLCTCTHVYNRIQSVKVPCVGDSIHETLICVAHLSSANLINSGIFTNPTSRLSSDCFLCSPCRWRSAIIVSIYYAFQRSMRDVAGRDRGISVFDFSIVREVISFGIATHFWTVSLVTWSVFLIFLLFRLRCISNALM